MFPPPTPLILNDNNFFVSVIFLLFFLIFTLMIGWQGVSETEFYKMQVIGMNIRRPLGQVIEVNGDIQTQHSIYRYWELQQHLTETGFFTNYRRSLSYICLRTHANWCHISEFVFNPWSANISYLFCCSFLNISLELGLHLEWKLGLWFIEQVHCFIAVFIELFVLLLHGLRVIYLWILLFLLLLYEGTYQ